MTIAAWLNKTRDLTKHNEDKRSDRSSEVKCKNVNFNGKNKRNGRIRA